MGQKDSNLNNRRNLLRPLFAFFLWPTNALLDLLPSWQSWTGQSSLNWSWVVAVPLNGPISLTPLSLTHTCSTSLPHLPYPVCVCVHVVLNHVWLSATLWTVAHQAPLSMQEFSRQEYWSRVPFSPPRGPSNHGIKPTSAALAGRFFTTEPPGKPPAVTTSHLLYTISTPKSAFILGQFW